MLFKKKWRRFNIMAIVIRIKHRDPTAKSICFLKAVHEKYNSRWIIYFFFRAANREVDRK